MNKIVYLLIIGLMFNGLYAQIQENMAPISQTLLLQRTGVPVVVMPDIDIETLRAEDEIVDEIKDIPWRYGFIHQTEIRLSNGKFTYLANGDRIWRVNISSPGAQTLNFTFSQYKLYGDAKLFIYNEDYSQTLGAFTKSNNKAHERLTTTLIEGDNITIELYEPKNTIGQNQLAIEKIIHGYRSLDYKKQLKDIGDSGSCNINSICSLGDNFRDQIKSVGIMLTQNNYSSGFCTGALINNTCHDGEPYFLTANHCLGNTNPNDIVVGFNFQSSQCSTNNWQTLNNTVSGTTLMANNAESDFALLKLSTSPPSTYNVFYAGWNRSTTPSNSQFGIHHPSGDLKKISKDNDPASSSTYSNAQCWEVGEWEHGTTEPGSSGSPLFNQDGLIIGQLYGGSASCTSISQDYYGRFDISWDYSSDISKQLKHWLDPCNTNDVSIVGYDPNQIIYDEDAAIQYDGSIVQDVCGGKLSQNIRIKNNGNQPLTYVNFTYGFDGNNQVHNWTGYLSSGQSESIDLDSVSLSTGLHEFSASILSTNLIADSNSLNDNIIFQTQTTNGVSVDINLLTNFNGSENNIEIVDYETNNVIEQQGPFGTMSSFNDSYCLPDGGYCITIIDDGGDGLFPLYFNIDSGYYVLNVAGQELYNGTDIGEGVTTCFKYYNGTLYLDTSTVINGLFNGIHNLNDIELYPNPSQGQFNVSSSAQIEKIQLFSIEGTLIYEKEVHNKSHLIHSKYHAPGIYIVKVLTSEGVSIKKMKIK